MGAVSEGRVVGGSNPGGGEGDSFLESFDSRATAVTSGAGLMDWCAVSRTLDVSDADGVANAPSTVATSETAQDTRLVSTTRAHTSSPARGIGRGASAPRRGWGEEPEFFLETRVWAKGRRRSRKLCVGGHPRTSPGGAIGSAEAALAQALVPLDVHLIAVEVRQVRAQLGDLRHALLELGGVLRMGRSHDGGELRERDFARMTGGSALSAARGMKRASSGASGRARRVGNRVQRSTDASSSRVRSETDAYGTRMRARGSGVPDAPSRCRSDSSRGARASTDARSTRRARRRPRVRSSSVRFRRARRPFAGGLRAVRTGVSAPFRAPHPPERRDWHPAQRSRTRGGRI